MLARSGSSRTGTASTPSRPASGTASSQSPYCFACFIASAACGESGNALAYPRNAKTKLGWCSAGNARKRRWPVMLSSVADQTERGRPALVRPAPRPSPARAGTRRSRGATRRSPAAPGGRRRSRASSRIASARRRKAGGLVHRPPKRSCRYSRASATTIPSPCHTSARRGGRSARPCQSPARTARRTPTRPPAAST